MTTDYNTPTRAQVRFEHLCKLLGANPDIGEYGDDGIFTGADFDNMTARQREQADARQDRGR